MTETPISKTLFLREPGLAGLSFGARPNEAPPSSRRQDHKGALLHRAPAGVICVSSAGAGAGGCS